MKKMKDIERGVKKKKKERTDVGASALDIVAEFSAATLGLGS